MRCVLLQIMIQCGQQRSGKIVAARAGFVRPAHLRTSGGFYHALPQIMFQRGPLHIGGIVTTRAGFVSITAGFRTSGVFCFVVHQIMVQCGQLFAGGIVAAGAGAGFVGVPALFRAGGGFCCVLLQIMVQRGQLCAGGIVAVFAGFVSIPANVGAGRGFCCVLLQVVTAVVTPSASFARSLRGAGRAAVAAAGCVLFFCVAVGVRAYAGVRAVAVRRPRAPCVTGDVVFRAAFFTDFALGAGGTLGTAGMYL